MNAQASQTPTPITPASGGAVSRFLRLHSFELLIFVIMFILLALCLAAAPLVSDDVAAPPGAPAPEGRLVL